MWRQVESFQPRATSLNTLFVLFYLTSLLNFKSELNFWSHFLASDHPLLKDDLSMLYSFHQT
jgi:hypothetical protein